MEQISEIIETDDNENNEDYSLIGQQKYEKLNQQQKQIVDTILNEFQNDTSSDNNTDEAKCFYIDGPGGSAKTFVYTTLWYLLKGMKKKHLYHGVYGYCCDSVTSRENSSQHTGITCASVRRFNFKHQNTIKRRRISEKS